MINSDVLLRERILLIILWMVIAAAILAPLSSSSLLPYHADYFNHVTSIVQATLGLKEDQFPLRVMPLEYSGWRYPLFQFYSPTGYTLAGLIYHWMTPANPILAFKITMWLLLVVGGAYMYKLVNWLVGSREIAILTSVMYLTSPYYIIVVDHMGGFNEALALGIIPAVLYYTLQRFYYPTQNKTLLQMALVWYLLATVHLITFIYSSIFMGLLLILLALKNRKQWLNLLDTGIGYTLGLLLAMWYLAPAFLFRNNLHSNQLYGTSSGFNNDPLSLTSLLSSSQNITLGPANTSGYIDSFNVFHPSLGCPLLLAIAICCYALLSKSKLENQTINEWLIPLLIVFAMSFVIVWSPFHFAALLPRIFTIGQYSWRMLGQVIWIGALLFAWAICWLFKNKLDIRHVVLGIFLMMTAASTWIPITESDFMPVNIEEMVMKPLMFYNKGMYLIDVKDKKNMHLINGIDSVDIGSILVDHKLILNNVYQLPLTLFNTAITPVLKLEGLLSNKDELPVQQVSILVNGMVASIQTLQPGPFYWEIPLSSGKKSLNHKATISLEFKSNKKTSEKIPLKVDKISIGGFQDKATIIGVKESESNCEQKNALTICRYQVAPETKLIELPVIYYPDLLNITLNGKVIPYSSMLYQNLLITAVAPLPGVFNTIEIEFRGLEWANFLSAVTWCLWLIFLLYVTLKHFTKVNPKVP